VAFCQLAGMAGVLIFRKPLLALFGQFGGRHAKVQHVGSSKAAQSVHQGLGTARQRVPIPAFARRQAAASAVPRQTTNTAVTATATSAGVTAGAGQTAVSGVNAASGAWPTLLGAVAIKGGQLAFRHGETAKRQLQGSVSPFLLDGKASRPPPRRMPEKPLGVDHAALRTHAWNKALRRAAPAALSVPAATAAPAAPQPRALQAPQRPPAQSRPERSPKPMRARWVREPGGAHVLQHKS
jgi:hypothetical protein